MIERRQFAVTEKNIGVEYGDGASFPVVNSDLIVRVFSSDSDVELRRDGRRRCQVEILNRDIGDSILRRFRAEDEVENGSSDAECDNENEKERENVAKTTAAAAPARLPFSQSFVTSGIPRLRIPVDLILRYLNYIRSRRWHRLCRSYSSCFAGVVRRRW